MLVLKSGGNDVTYPLLQHVIPRLVRGIQYHTNMSFLQMQESHVLFVIPNEVKNLIILLSLPMKVFWSTGK